MRPASKSHSTNVEIWRLDFELAYLGDADGGEAFLDYEGQSLEVRVVHEPRDDDCFVPRETLPRKGIGKHNLQRVLRGPSQHCLGRASIAGTPALHILRRTGERESEFRLRIKRGKERKAQHNPKTKGKPRTIPLRFISSYRDTLALRDWTCRSHYRRHPFLIVGAVVLHLRLSVVRDDLLRRPELPLHLAVGRDEALVLGPLHVLGRRVHAPTIVRVLQRQPLPQQRHLRLQLPDALPRRAELPRQAGLQLRK